MLSDQVIVTGIKTGGLRENEAIQELYRKYDSLFQKYIDLESDAADASIIWQGVECLVNGVKYGLIDVRPDEEGNVIERVLETIFQSLTNLRTASTEGMFQLLEDKIVWDYYLKLLQETEGVSDPLITRSLGEESSIEELAGKLVAQAKYTTVEDVKNRRDALLYELLEKL